MKAKANLCKHGVPVAECGTFSEAWALSGWYLAERLSDKGIMLVDDSGRQYDFRKSLLGEALSAAGQ